MRTKAEIMENINTWREEVWDETLLGYMNWCKRGVELHKELSELGEKDE